MATNFLKRAFDPLGLLAGKDMGTVFVTSGTGEIGNRVANSLLEAGHKTVRVGVWKGKRALGVDDSVGQYVADKLEGKGATVITFDWTNADHYVMALAEVKIVFFTMPLFMEGEGPALLDKFTAFVSACRKAGVEHFVTASNDQPWNGAPYNQLLRQCNEVLKKPAVDSRMSYTILHTAHLMSTPLVLLGPILRKEKLYITASYSMGVNYVSPNDVAHAVVAVLSNWKKHKGKSYRITGSWPPVKDKDVAKLLSDFYDGQEIKHSAIGYHDYEEELQKRGDDLYPAGVIAYAVACEKVKASGDEEQQGSYSGDLEKLIGATTTTTSAASSGAADEEQKQPDATKPSTEEEAGGGGDGGEAKAADAPAPSAAKTFQAETFAEYLANKETMTLQENPRDVEV